VPRGAAAVLLAGVIAAPGAGAAEHELADAPLFVVQGAQPNILLTMDDSGSMAQSNMPDTIVSLYDRVQVLSSTVNTIYYDPAVTYRPPTDASGASLGNASFTNAWSDGYNKAGTCRVNLATSFRPTWDLGNNCDSRDTWNGSFYGPEYIGEPQAAYFYRFDPSNARCNGSVSDDDCYDKVVVSATTAPPGVDGRTNFANWYSYYRKRSYLAKAAASMSFANLSNEVRVGYQRINNTSLTGVRLFSEANRAQFYSWLFAMPASGGTPLRLATQRAGEYFSSDAPYRQNPGSSASEILSCRQNFHILMTDGYWNGEVAISGNRDNQSHSLPGGGEFSITSYSPRPPYRDTNDSYLADHTFHYWVTDLRPGLTNNVPTSIRDTSTDIDGSGGVDEGDIFWNPRNNPAHWQHMVTYTIGLGVQGGRDYPEDYDDLVSGALSWPANEIDDLWHAAINSRGQYLSANNSQGLVDAFNDVINRITETTGSYAPVALNSGTVSSESSIYFSRFETNGWTGHVLARPISDGSSCGAVPAGELCPVLWDAGCKLTGGPCAATGGAGAARSPGDRAIVTLNSATGEGVPLRWGSLSAAQRALLSDPDGTGPVAPREDPYGEEVLNFLRGARSMEASRGGTFRNRQSILGDTIASPPLFVGAPNRFYPGAGAAIAELASYGEFRVANREREPVVYIGANDGMLHAFRASDGHELFAYVPGQLFGKLWRLADPAYQHTNYVDGPASENDVYFSGAWHTVLVSGLGLGGQGYFALNITNPASISEAGAGALPLWEFTDGDDPDLGYSYAKPAIVRLKSGRWAAVFGNGVNATANDQHRSATGNGVVFIVDIHTGALIRKLDTGVGSAADPLELSRPNGILGVFPADVEDEDFITDRLYATDLFGNVWAFDLSSANPAQWRSAYGSGGNPQPFYTAVRGGVRQPITSPPVVADHPMGGAMVLFGTGQYLGLGDITNRDVQSYYGIWDRLDEPAGSGRARLLEQTITTVSAPGPYDARIVSNHGITWDDGRNPQEDVEKIGWYMDLPEPGERVFQRSFVRTGRLIFPTVTPSDDPCEAGGFSWLMEVDPLDGARLNFTVFDFNRDRSFNADDQIDGVDASGIRNADEGVNSEPSIINNGDGRTEIKFYTSSDGQARKLDENTRLNRRTPWRQVR